MVNTTQMQKIRDRVSSLIDDYGNTVLLTTEGNTTYDAWGEPSLSSQVETTTVGVTDNRVIAQMQLGSFGRIKGGESIVLLKGTETVDESYTITMDSVVYNIMNLEKFEAANVTVAYRVAVQKA